MTPLPHTPITGPSNHTCPNAGAEGPVSSECQCDYPIVAVVNDRQTDEDFYFYRRCEVHEKEQKHLMSVGTLKELKGLGYRNLTEAGKKWLEELTEQENQTRGRSTADRGPHKAKAAGSIPARATKFKSNYSGGKS